MGYFDEKKNVEEYLRLADGYDGAMLVDVLEAHLAPGSTVLELGMGPGKDLDLLARHYAVTGSDSSAVFLDLYREKHAEADLLALDAATLETDRKFDCIYSNKVLHHLTREDLVRSFQRQQDLLTDGGLLMHSFWFGDSEEDINGLRFVYYTEDGLLSSIGPGFDAIATERYTEMEDDDSFYVLLRKVG